MRVPLLKSGLLIVAVLAVQADPVRAQEPPPPAEHAGHTSPVPSSEHQHHESQDKGSKQKPAPQDPAMDHRSMEAGQMEHGEKRSEQTDHAQHGGATDHDAHKQTGPDLAPITPADLEAAFPEIAGGHAVHDRAVHTYLLFDQLEWRDGDEGALTWDLSGWAGGDLQRLWVRSEGERVEGSTAEAEIQALWGRRFSRWWEFVAGARHDFEPGPSQTWAAFGVQGLAPYWFEVEATAYLGEAGQSALRLEAEYEFLLTNRLVAQPLIELNFHGKSDPERGIGSGFSSAEVGFRLRYEIRREIAPYVGFTWVRSFGRTADLAEFEGEDTDDVRAVAGLRVWF
jgi:copper resistance protein B